MIHVTDLTKRYGPTTALDRLSLEVPAGAVFGLLGPNGAGKTTLLRLIMGFVFPDDGQIDRGGLSPSHIGYLPERAFYPPRSTIQGYLATVGRLVGLLDGELRQVVSRLLAQFSLEQVAHRRLGACSRGMLQRLGVAQALIGEPPLLVLDEPVAGLDPAGQKFMREQIVGLQQSGKTVLLASHHLDEVTRVCTHVAVLKGGRLVRSGPLETILAPHPQVTIITSPLPADLPARLTALCNAAGTIVSDNRVGDNRVAETRGARVTLTGEAIACKAEVLRLLLDAGVDIYRLDEEHATLEEIYLEATGR